MKKMILKTCKGTTIDNVVNETPLNVVNKTFSDIVYIAFRFPFDKVFENCDKQTSFKRKKIASNNKGGIEDDLRVGGEREAEIQKFIEYNMGLDKNQYKQGLKRIKYICSELIRNAGCYSSYNKDVVMNIVEKKIDNKQYCGIELINYFHPKIEEKNMEHNLREKLILANEISKLPYNEIRDKVTALMNECENNQWTGAGLGFANIIKIINKRDVNDNDENIEPNKIFYKIEDAGENLKKLTLRIAYKVPENIKK